MSRIRLPSSGSALSRLKQLGFSRLTTNSLIGQLVDAGELHLDDASQQGGERGAEIAAETLVERLQGPHLLFADAFRPFEVVGGDLLAADAAREPCAGGSAAGNSPRRCPSR